MTRQGSRRRAGRDGLIQTYACYQAQELLLSEEDIEHRKSDLGWRVNTV